MEMTDLMPGMSSGMETLGFDTPPINADATPVNDRNLRTSLRQWRMFQAVIDFDGFGGAADGLNVTQSTISHAVAKLQEQLGISLLVLKGRKAELTEQGKILLGRSRDLLRNAVELEELAENLKQGWGAEVRLIIHGSFPTELLMLAIRRLSPFPQSIRLSVKEATIEQAAQALHGNSVDLAISTQVPFGFVGKELVEIDYVAVAHPENPLFALKRKITADDLRTQSQVAISGTSDDAAVYSGTRFPRYPRPWNVSSIDSAIGVLRYGLAYACLPRYRAQQWLDRHEIRILPLAHGAVYSRTLYLIHGRPADSDALVKRFAEALHLCSGQFFFDHPS